MADSNTDSEKKNLGDSWSSRGTVTTNTSLATTDAELLRKKRAVTPYLIYCLGIIAFGSSFQFGYNIGVINAPAEHIKDFIYTNHVGLWGEIDRRTVVVIFSVAVSLFPAGAMIGALMSGYLADRFGRRRTLHFNNVLAILGAALMTSTKYLQLYPLFLIGRFVIGLNAGISSSVVPMYFTELSPVKLRGTVASLPQLMVTISILISAVLGLPFLLGSEDRWPWLFSVMAFPAVCQIVGMFWVPESPRYTLFFKGYDEDALDDLIDLRGDGQVATVELHALQIEKRRESKTAKINVGTLFRKSDFRWPLFLAAFLMVAQQLSGINAAMFFSVKIFQRAGLDMEGAIYATIGVNTVNVLMTIVSAWLVDLPRFGRRSLLLIGKIGMIFTSVGLVITMVYARDSSGIVPYISCVFLPLFVVFFATGPGSIPFFYVSEVFPSNARASASAVCVAINWTFTVVVGIGFLPLENILKEFTFLIFTGCCTVAAIVIFIFLPETKGKTVEEVREDMMKRKKRLC
uniref:MFS domain-containing protein n=2 Tax=Bursaphelenchus xylophilus TaxID=6326 RepID=A0A1I7S3N7_BURXY